MTRLSADIPDNMLLLELEPNILYYEVLFSLFDVSVSIEELNVILQCTA